MVRLGNAISLSRSAIRIQQSSEQRTNPTITIIFIIAIRFFYKSGIVAFSETIDAWQIIAIPAQIIIATTTHSGSFLGQSAD